MKAPINNLPTEIPAAGPYTISIILGGIRIPKEPPAQILPVAKLLSYPRRIIDGSATSVSIVIEAAIIPTQDARIVPINTLTCLLYTSDAADEEDSVDLGGRRIIKKKKKKHQHT